MSNMKNKNNARTGGAVSSPNKGIDFINTGHAAQARYMAALANPFASPAVPIPDSFLEAHVSKLAKEMVIDDVQQLQIKVYKSTDEPTGDYKIQFKYKTPSGWTDTIIETSEIGLRLVAAGIAFEDVGQLDSLEGVITYSQENIAYLPGFAEEVVSKSERLSRNVGHGTILYEPMRRQALEFEGDAYTILNVYFSAQRNIIARFCVIAETDGKQGFVERETSNKDFNITSSYPNHHAGIFGDTPMPALDHSLMVPSHTQVINHNPVAHDSALQAAAHWVSSAAGWAWKHKDAIGNALKKSASYYQAMTRYGGSIMSNSGQIMALGARAAPLAIAL